MRQINKEFSEAYNLTLNKYKYFTEFRVKDSDLIKNNKNILAKKDIRIELVIDSLYSKNNRLRRSTRAESVTKRVVGRYASYNDVINLNKIL